MRILDLVIVMLLFGSARSQEYNTSRIFAHNDYVRADPFYTAYNLGVGYIEADVYLVGDELLVAHQRNETDAGKTLTSLYLQPLATQVAKNRGSAYAEPGRSLTLMIDLKSEGSATLGKLVERLREYPTLLACPTLHFMVSGNVPPAESWKNYPLFISIDGRPGISYTEDQLRRVAMISTNFRDHAVWDGKGELSSAERDKITRLVDEAHSKGKKIRFWATPDFENAWQQQVRLNFDVICSDDVAGLARFLTREK